MMLEASPDEIYDIELEHSLLEANAKLAKDNRALLDKNGSVVQFDGLQPNAGQDTIAANTLQAGQNYRYILFFSNDAVGIDTQLQLNSRTQGFFTTAGGATATPEPASAVLALLGAGALFGFKRRMAS